ncbi:MAG: alpha/beta hydrolase [bacterium]|nr:alpha/beta hydrolase [bacterium]
MLPVEPFRRLPFNLPIAPMLINLLTILFVSWLLLNLVAIAVICYLFLTLPAPERPADGKRLKGESVRFTTRDGILLAGTFVAAPGRKQAPCVIFGHPFGGDRHAAARSAGFLPEAGFHLFAFDFRGHGESPSDDGYRPERWATWRERDDLLAAVSYCSDRPDVASGSIGLFGLSRGANAALCGAAAHPAVRAVAAESAFSTRELLKWHVMKRAPIYVNLPWLWRHIPDPLHGFSTDLSLGVMRLLLRRRYLSVERAVAGLNGRACLFIHGERDTYIDISLTQQLFAEAGEPKALWIVPGARHNEGLVAAPDAYQERVSSFFRRYLEGASC